MERNFSFVVAFLLMGHFSDGQTRACEAYWVVETNRNLEPFTIVKIYDVYHQIVVERKIDGIVVDIKSRRHRRTLRRVIDHYYEQPDTEFPDRLFQFHKKTLIASRKSAQPRRRESADVFSKSLN
jgi:hypothetical protein